MKTTPGILILQDGTEFEGTLVGSATQWEKYLGFGEVVFNTGMSGYQEILTDPSYAGQMIVMTLPHLGNTGINPVDWESGAIHASGFIIHDLSEDSPHWEKTSTLIELLIEQKIPVLTGIETRALTRKLRSTGVTRGIIASKGDSQKARSFLHSPSVPHADQVDWLSRITQPKTVTRAAPSENRYRVAVLDFGIKMGLVRELEKRGCALTVIPAHLDCASIIREVESIQPDGLFLSNGPGDPSMATQATEALRQLLGKLPIFGVCMGHQVLAQALGGKTYKLKFGHRGANQPVLNHETGRVEISSHNHGYAADASSLPPSVEVTHIHLNDNSVEGLRWKAPEGLAPAFSVQYHPEASPGPHDSASCFDRFVSDIASGKKKTQP